MNHKKILLGLMLAELGMVGAVQAATYTNTVTASTPFGITLNNGGFGWGNQQADLNSSDTGVVNTTYSHWSYPTVVYETVEPAAGVDGVMDIYLESRESVYDYTYQTQDFHIGYSDYLSTTTPAPQTYVLSGQIQNLTGTGLVNGGLGYLDFQLSMLPQFAEPYLGESANATLLFRFGTAQGEWNYSFEKSFNLSSGSIVLDGRENANYYFDVGKLDLSGLTYFEAHYSIDAAPGVLIDSSGLGLALSGAVNTSSASLNHQVVERTLIRSIVLPALPVPEPETYAMMLAGLGLVGFAARRRTRTAV